MIYLEDAHKSIIDEVLQRYSHPFYAFGSRVTGKHKEFSDLDLCFKTPIDDKTLFAIMSAFEESDLPFKVDIVDYHKCDVSFQRLIDQDLTRV